MQRKQSAKKRKRTRRRTELLPPLLPEGQRIYTPLTEGVAVPDAEVTRPKRRPNEVRISGYVPLRANELVSWERQWPGHTKLVRITVMVQREDLRDLAVASGLDDLRALFFIPALKGAGPQARGRSARATEWKGRFVMVSRLLLETLKSDHRLADAVRHHAKAEEYTLRRRPRIGDIRELLAYMVDSVWGRKFEKLGLRPPLPDVEEFWKDYLRPRFSRKRPWLEQDTSLYRLHDKTIQHFDSSYFSRLSKSIATDS